MGQELYMTRMAPALLARYLADDSSAFDEIEELPEAHRLMVSQVPLHILHLTLTGEFDGGAPPLCNVLKGWATASPATEEGELIHNPQQVAEAAAALARINDAGLRVRFDRQWPKAVSDFYLEEKKEWFWAQVVEAWREVLPFYGEASRAGEMTLKRLG